jgi:hypothetical protein
VAAAPTIEYRPWRPAWWAALIVGAAVVGLGLGAIIAAVLGRGELAGQEYHLWRWQADNFTSSVFQRIGIGPDPDDTAGPEALRKYFALTSQIRAAVDAETPDTALVETLTNERGVYERDVENLLVRYISEAVRTAGLDQRLPLFSAVKVVWPPVDFKLTSPPRLLVRSPRDTIKRSGDTLLKNGLTLREIERIERETDSQAMVSLIVSIGGLAAYPAIVRDDRPYDAILETTAHEWVHHYLAFYPLGQQWGKGGEAERLNETTANIAGRELAALIRKRHPVKLTETESGRPPPAKPPTVDFNKEMRKLRLEVDALLKDGKVEEAERTMEARRKYFADNGIFIRRLNQAYFAFYGTYGDSPASSAPSGSKIERVWKATNDVGLFLKVMREIRTTGDLDAALARLEGSRSP